MSSDVSVSVENLSKCFHIYNRPRDRLLQMLSFGRKQYFREFWAVQGVSFDIRRNETIGVIGRNGSGKSTLLQLLSGTLNPTSGSVGVKGRVAALLELGAGFNSDFTGRENVYLNASLYGFSREEIDGRFDKIAEFADIGDFIDQPVKTYSSGMFVRLAFAVQVHTEPDVFLIDEALAVGDHRFVQKCYRKMAEIKNGGASLILVSHDTTAIKILCDKAIWMHDGKIAEIGNASEVVDAYRNWSDNIERTAIKSSVVLFDDEQEGLAITQIRLLDQGGKDTSGFIHGSPAKIEIAIVNNGIAAQTPLRLGFSVRNNRGIEIFGSNTDVMKFDLRAPSYKKATLACIEFDLPLLAAGQYSVSISLDALGGQGWTTEILMPDCVCFDVDEKIKVYTLLGVDARMSATAVGAL